MKKNDIRRVSFKQLRKYGTVIVRWLQDNGEEAVLLVSQYYTNEFIRNYSDFFEVHDNDDSDSYIELKQTKSVDDLRNHFRAYLSIDMLIAFTQKNSLCELDIRV